jgi:hypothetical protein
MNLFGDVEVTDFDGTVLSEKDMAVRWGVMFTPDDDLPARRGARGHDRAECRRGA